MKKKVLDIEVYTDFFLVAIKDIDTGRLANFAMYPGKLLDVTAVKAMLNSSQIITFNGNSYDLPLLNYALGGATTQQIKQMSDRIIVGGEAYWQLGLSHPDGIDHIDLIEVAPGQAGLKLYGGRLHCPKLQDLPIDPAASITQAQRSQLAEYCKNDLDITEGLYRALIKQIDLRVQMSDEYGQDLRSKSDAQIAEAVISAKLTELSGKKPTKPKVAIGTKYKYVAPAFISYTTQVMQDTLEFVKGCEIVIDKNGSPKCEALESHIVKIGSSEYRMGVGGLHSSESKTAHIANDDTLLIDRDVASYYPAIILNCKLYPTHMGTAFLDVYQDIVTRRLEAKRSGDKVVADSLKITINGSFGKFGSKYSILYSPDLLIQTTITGQLSLLMLIEALEQQGIPVVSANTDGIVIKCPKAKVAEMDAAVWLWEFFTGFETEDTHYKALYSRDVNNYIAIKTNGEVKTKGVFATTGLMKSPAGSICGEAAIRQLADGTPIATTIRECNDIRKFVNLRTVKGGAVCDGEYLGKSVRWYYAKNKFGAIHYSSNGNKVATSDGAMPIMQLPDELPDDIDYCRYINDAACMLKDVGA